VIGIARDSRFLGLSQKFCSFQTQLTPPLSLLVSKATMQARVVLLQVPSLLWDLGMSPLVSLFYCMTLIYFSYAAISYKVELVCMGDLFMLSSLIHHLEAPVEGPIRRPEMEVGVNGSR
jgi:hypothetical protein